MILRKQRSLSLSLEEQLGFVRHLSDAISFIPKSKILSILLFESDNNKFEDLFSDLELIYRALNGEKGVIYMRPEDYDCLTGSFQNFPKEKIIWFEQNVFTYTSEKESCIDIAIIIGTDKTNMQAIRLFTKRETPPIISIERGSAGFIAKYRFADIEKHLLEMFSKFYSGTEVRVEKKMRIKATVINKLTGLKETHLAMNEIVIDRGPSPSCIRVDILLNEEPLTEFFGDGLIFATPNGSTAYSLAGGGPIIHNSLQMITMVPIAPHSLSFRPLVYSKEMKVRLRQSPTCRINPYLSADGRRFLELTQDHEIIIKASLHNAIFVLDNPDQIFDAWIAKLTHLLNWNTHFKEEK